MKMIIGGAFQGQLDWAIRNLNIEPESFIDGKTCEMDAICTCKGIYDFHEYVKRWMKEEKKAKEESWEEFATGIVSENQELVIVSNEIGYGIVPVDAFEREYREQVGRICTALAAESELVVRVVMGVGQVLKGDYVP